MAGAGTTWCSAGGEGWPDLRPVTRRSNWRSGRFREPRHLDTLDFDGSVLRCAGPVVRRIVGDRPRDGVSQFGELQQ